MEMHRGRFRDQFSGGVGDGKFWGPLMPRFRQMYPPQNYCSAAPGWIIKMTQERTGRQGKCRTLFVARIGSEVFGLPYGWIQVPIWVLYDIMLFLLGSGTANQSLNALQHYCATQSESNHGHHKLPRSIPSCGSLYWTDLP